MNNSERLQRAEAVAQRGLYPSKHEYVKAIVAAYLGDDTVYRESRTTCDRNDIGIDHSASCYEAEERSIWVVPLNMEDNLPKEGS